MKIKSITRKILMYNKCMKLRAQSPDTVPLRLVWPLEASHFTRWLAANLPQLATALGLSLSLLPNKAVGEMRIVDLFARNEADGSLVLIENQLEPADDAHLGQILAYLAGSGARTLVWIAKDFDERQLDVVRWLNTATIGDYRFFAVRIEVLQGTQFELEPRFNVLEAPSGWLSPTSPPKDASAPFGFAASFWAAHVQWRPEEAAASHPVGPRCRWRATGVRSVVIGVHVEPNAAKVFLRGRNGVTRNAALEALALFTERIEQELDVVLNDASCDVLAQTRLAVDMTDPAKWPQASEWLSDQAQRYDAILSRRAFRSVNKN